MYNSGMAVSWRYFAYLHVLIPIHQSLRSELESSRSELEESRAKVTELEMTLEDKQEAVKVVEKKSQNMVSTCLPN